MLINYDNYLDVTLSNLVNQKDLNYYLEINNHNKKSFLLLNFL